MSPPATRTVCTNSESRNMNNLKTVVDGLSYLELHADRLLAEGLESAVELRRRIHGDPRVSGDERDTAELLVDRLGLLDGEGEWVTDGYLARLGGPGPAVALRTELDALPIPEETGVPWAATGSVAHLCGHDVHMAALSLVVDAIRAVGFPVPLVVALQPREETLPCGAEDFMRSDWLHHQDIRAFIGAHVQPSIPAGTVSAIPGAVNASADEFTITVSGRASHGAYPHLSRDPIVAAAAVILAIQQLVSRRTDPMEPAVITVGEIRSGSSFNAIPGVATLRGTIRTYTEESRAAMQELLSECASAVALGYGCEAETSVGLGEPVLHNDETLAHAVSDSLVAAGFARGPELRSCGADDFSFYCARFPALMVFVGTGDAAEGAPGLHHPRFLPDDSAVLDVARVLLASYITAGRLILHTTPQP